MTPEFILSLVVGNVPAAILLFAWTRDRDALIMLRDKYERTLLAMAGYRTEPDTQNIVKMVGDPPAARPEGTYPIEKN